MTLNEKAEASELDIAVITEIASSIGIEVDPSDKLAGQDAIKLGRAVTAYKKNGVVGTKEKAAPKGVFRIWSDGKNKTIFLGEVLGSIKIQNYALVLDVDADKKTIEIIKRIKNVLGLYEVHDVPFDEDEQGEEYDKFDDLLRGLLFTGSGGQVARAGIKAVRALFSTEELLSFKDGAFNAKRLIHKAMSTKSITQIHNV